MLWICTRIDCKTSNRFTLASVKGIATESIQLNLMQIEVATDEIRLKYEYLRGKPKKLTLIA